MSKSPTILWLLAALTAGGCMTESQFLASRQPTAIQVAESRGQFFRSQIRNILLTCLTQFMSIQ